MSDEPMWPYRVGIICPARGLNDAQISVLVERLKMIAKTGRENIVVCAIGQDPSKPEEYPASIAKTLAYKARFKLEPLKRFSPGGIWNLGAHLWRATIDCDEVWCCPGLNEGQGSKTRTMDVWRRSQGTPSAHKYKLLPAWTQAAFEPAPVKKGKKHDRPAKQARRAWSF